MPELLDILLVLLTVLAAAAYLVWRKIRAARKIARDWSSGHADQCGHCAALEIRKAQLRRER